MLPYVSLMQYFSGLTPPITRLRASKTTFDAKNDTTGATSF
jgi:hypothetical protein